MDQINKALLNQLTQKIGVMKGMQMSDEEIEKSFDKSELDLIEKARSHKYIRKEGDRYIYEENDHDTRKVGRNGYSGPKDQEDEYGGDLSNQPKSKSTPEEDAERKRISKLEEDDDLNQEKPSKKKEETFKVHPQVKSVMNSLSTVNSKYSDPKKVTVEATPKGNWRIYYSGKDTGTTLNTNILSEETIMKVGWEHHSRK